MSSFHGVGIEEFYCIQRWPHFIVGIKGFCSHFRGSILYVHAGQGFDRHLFALRVLAKNEGIQVPLFEDPCYSHINEIILSTSTLASDAVLLGGFAPVNANSYGIGYGVFDDWLGVQVATYPSRDGARFVEHMEKVFDDIFAVSKGNNFKK